jgi:hypothetical protein
MRRRRLYLLKACFAVVWAATDALLLVRLPPVLMPQAGSGGDFLSVLLGDAKAEISGAFVHEADSYFHGGIDMECHALHEHDEHGDVRGQAHDAHDHGDNCSCGHCGHADETLGEKRFDPWHWINSHIRAPEIERHLEGEKAVEMMPWFWAAVKSDPHNEEAWSTAWYVASRIMNDKPLALKIAEEGWRLNPSSMEIACAVGRSCRDKETFDVERSERMFGLALDMGLGKKEMTEKEQFSFAEAISYLADGAQKRKDRNALARLLEKATLKTPCHPIVNSIRQKMDSL